tara:strand:+ start:13527 stop:14429 length:903 start_codon:yes stop_codon:yes gene_type:complete
MDFKIVLKKHIFMLIALTIMATIASCQPDELGTGNGLSDPNVDASFTVTPIEGVTNRYRLEAQTINVLSSKWDVGDGIFSGKMTEEVFFPDAGTYIVTHIAVGKGGETNTTTQEIVVAQSDPVSGNIVKGGKFEDTAAHSEWTIQPISDSGASWVLNDGGATIFSTSAWAQQGIYQAIDVVKDKEYTIDMKVSGGGGFINTWFEVYVGTTPPVDGVEYSANGTTDFKIMGLSTWDGCATAPFSGRLTNVGCVKNSKTDAIDNTITFAETGTIYLYIRSGGEVFDPSGITITNVEMRGTGN